MHLNVTLERAPEKGVWHQVAATGEPAPTVRLPSSDEWSTRAQQALQLGLRDIHDRLVGTGVDDARLSLEIRSEGHEADVRAALEAGDERVVRNRSNGTVEQAVRDAMRALARAVDAGGLPATEPTDEVEPWDRLTDAAHRYARHAVARAERRHEVGAGRIDPRDLAGEALAARLEADRELDLGVDIPSVCTWIDGLLAGKLGTEDDDPEHQSLQAFVDRLADANERPPDAAPLQMGDTVGVGPETPTLRGEDVERAHLTRALFHLPPAQRYLFAEVAVDGFELGAVAGARSLELRHARAIFQGATASLAEVLDRDEEAVLQAYRTLGEALRRERATVAAADAGRAD